MAQSRKRPQVSASRLQMAIPGLCLSLTKPGPLSHQQHTLCHLAFLEFMAPSSALQLGLCGLPDVWLPHRHSKVAP